MDCYTKWNNWLGKRMFLLVLAALIAGFTVEIPNSPAVRTAVIAFFAYMTFITSLETSLKRFAQVLSRPWVPLWALFLVHIATPLLAWSVGYLFFPEDIYVRLGYLISASIPVGVTSIIWTALVNGNVAMSLVTVTLDTLIAPVFLPFFFLVTIGQALQIDYLQMAAQLVMMITIPSIAGMALHDRTEGRVAGFAKGIGGLSSKVAFFLVIFINAGIVAPLISVSLALVKMALVTLFMVSAGYFLGYVGSQVFRNPSRETTMAMMYNVGLRNISAGLVLALSHFPPAVTVPMTLFILFQQPLASLVPYAFRRLEKKP